MEKDKAVTIVFKEKRRKITNAILQHDCTFFAQRLKEEEIITGRKYVAISRKAHSEQDLASKLVKLVSRKLQRSPIDFEKFLTCLEEVDRDLANEVDAFYKGEVSC